MTCSGAYALPPTTGIVLPHVRTVADVARSADFYSRVLGGQLVRSGEPTVVQLATSWVILNLGGGPTDDKPTVFLHPPTTADEATSFMNIRVADIHACYDACYDAWRQKGAAFLTEPKDPVGELRCYLRDPDGYLIEVGQTRY
jgi:lactoylglutathione lyase